MLVVRYTSEAERKRFEYLLDKWEQSLRIEKPSGSILIVSESPDKVLRFLEELYSKIPRERVDVYKIVEPDFYLEPLVLEGVVESSMSAGEAWGAIGLVFARLKGVLVSETRGERVYKVSVKKGTVTVRVIVEPGDRGSRIRFIVEGYGEVVPHIYNKLVREFSYLGEVVGHE